MMMMMTMMNSLLFLINGKGKRNYMVWAVKNKFSVDGYISLK